MYRHIASSQGGTVTKHVLTDHDDDDWCFGARPASAGYMTPVSQLPALKQDEKKKLDKSGDVRGITAIHR